MSVLLTNRTVSKAEYINVAIEVEKDTIEFLSRLSVRYQRIFQDRISNLVIDIVSDCEIANSYFPNTKEAVETRAALLKDAVGKYHALDVQMALIYDIIMLNPSGAFQHSGEKQLLPSEAKNKIEKMAEKLGNNINKGENLLRNIIESDSKRIK